MRKQSKLSSAKVVILLTHLFLLLLCSGVLYMGSAVGNVLGMVIRLPVPFVAYVTYCVSWIMIKEFVVETMQDRVLTAASIFAWLVGVIHVILVVLGKVGYN